MLECHLKKLSILHITTFLQGGAGRILCSLAVEQKNRGARVIVVTDDSPCQGYENYAEYLEILQDAGIDRYAVNSLFKRKLDGNLRAASVVRQLILQEEVNLVHANAAIPALVGIIARSGIYRKIPVVLSMQGWGCNKTIEQENTDIAILNLVDVVFPVSFAAQELLRGKGVVNDKLVVIPNTVDVAGSNECNDDLTRNLREWHLRGIRVIGCIGTICDRKDQATLIRALSSEGLGNIKVVFIGEGKIDEMRGLAEKLGVLDQVIFAGYRQTADRYLRQFDVVVLASRSEGLPLTILEAFRDRTPVIGSDIPTIAELVKDGVTGHLFQVGNVADLRRKLVVVLGESPDLRQSYCEAAYSLYRQNYTVDKMCKDYTDQYVSLLYP